MGAVSTRSAGRRGKQPALQPAVGPPSSFRRQLKPLGECRPSEEGGTHVGEVEAVLGKEVLVEQDDGRREGDLAEGEKGGGSGE